MFQNKAYNLQPSTKKPKIVIYGHNRLRFAYLQKKEFIFGIRFMSNYCCHTETPCPLMTYPLPPQK